MGNLEELVKKGKVTVEELANAKDLVNRAELVINGIRACKMTIDIPDGQEMVRCYAFMAHGGDYEAIGYCTKEGVFICYSLEDGKEEIGRCNLNDPKDVFMALGDIVFQDDLRHFLMTQIREAKEKCGGNME